MMRLRALMNAANLPASRNRVLEMSRLESVKTSAFCGSMLNKTFQEVGYCGVGSESGVVTNNRTTNAR